MESVFAWSIVSGHRNSDNPARWADNLKEVLPAPSKVAEVKHQPALPWQDMPAFMLDLRKREGMGAKALEFLIYTAARSKEVREARWSQIDLENRLWTIQKLDMKGGRDHIVPLSDDAIALLESQVRIQGCDYVFPSANEGLISDMTVSAVTRRMHADKLKSDGKGYVDSITGKTIVPHGFRSSFKDWARNYEYRDSHGYPHRFEDEVSEMAIAHVNNDATRAAYARDKLLPQRKKLMRHWCEWLKGNVIVEQVKDERASVVPIRAQG